MASFACARKEEAGVSEIHDPPGSKTGSRGPVGAARARSTRKRCVRSRLPLARRTGLAFRGKQHRRGRFGR